MARPSTIAAIVVTYRPESATLQALLDGLVPQVDRLWLVDNASANVESIRELASERGASLITNSANLGVAAALNQGIAAARAAGCDCVLLMDQDSLPADDMVIHLHEALQAGGERLAAVGPAHVDVRTGHAAPFVRIGFPFNHKLQPVPGEIVDCDFLITSGCLISLRAIDAIGDMDVGLFIDNVDLEWCFRAKTRGYRLAGVTDARMMHRIGDRLHWRPRGRAIVHGPSRLYTIMRNRVLLYRRRDTPWRWIAQDIPRALLKFLGFSLVVAPRRANLLAMCRGLRDGLAGREGPDPDVG
ncbi:glycosyltransferase family 2 protein [Solilutibacter silvestris]|uniref:Glycosyl transferase family 2 n=1 Tax=Solilutibacter silvestris TaxID=1645665 RepID=A0A2K1PXF2_9GAMM|nr:glycosyltransferase family 2 protein [Lysobacter silvestris]PNS07472.1 Glycosyl transferase family 2 [Lysobacter silvestris]